MNTNQKIAVGLLGAGFVLTRKALRRSLKLNQELILESEKKTAMIDYLANMIESNEVPVTDFDKIALVNIWYS